MDEQDRNRYEHAIEALCRIAGSPPGGEPLGEMPAADIAIAALLWLGIGEPEAQSLLLRKVIPWHPSRMMKVGDAQISVGLGDDGRIMLHVSTLARRAWARLTLAEADELADELYALLEPHKCPRCGFLQCACLGAAPPTNVAILPGRQVSKPLALVPPAAEHDEGALTEDLVAQLVATFGEAPSEERRAVFAALTEAFPADWDEVVKVALRRADADLAALSADGDPT